MLTFLTAALAGTVHVFSGPDHLAAVAPLAIVDRRRGWLAGWTWGAGHASGVVTVAMLAVGLRDMLPPMELIASWSERLVGGALIAVGLWAVRSGFQIKTSRHAHGGVAHAHIHIQTGPPIARRLGHAHAAFAMGLLHGVAGSSHFLGVLPALALPTRSGAFVYLAGFGTGSVLAMTAFAALAGAAGSRSLNGAHAHRALVFASAAMAIAVGGVWLVV